jgi:hypothetical protein
MEEALQNNSKSKEKTGNSPDSSLKNSVIEQGHILNDWFVFREERHFGPMSTKQVRYLLSKKMVASGHFIWRPGFTGWTQIGEVESFRSYGKEEIDNLTDDDFSKKAMLSGIDRIGWEKNEIDFIDKKNSNAYELEQIRMTRTSRGVSSEPGFMEKVNNFFGAFGPDFRYGQAVVGFLAVAFLFGGIVTANRSETNTTLEGFSSAIQERLTAISAKAETVRNPSFVMFEKTSSSGDPILVSSTNLPLGSRVLIDVVGKPETLLGAYRFNQKFEMNLDSKIFSTNPIREASGKFIPPGTYTVFAKCLSCSETDRNLFAKDFTFGITDRVAYTAGLAKFHTEARQNARLELLELGDLSGNLTGQFSKTGQMFARAVTGKEITRWERFSAGWLLNQRKLIDLFEQMEKAEFQNKLYYLPLYNAYNSVVKDIFELHILQDELIKTDLADQGQIVEESKLSQKIKGELASLKSSLDLMNVNFNKTNGLPGKTGLNL